MPSSASRDRHGRGLRGPLFPHDAPRSRSPREEFDALVLDAYAPIQQSFADQLQGLDIAVDTIPRMRLSADMTVLPEEIFADGPVPLGRIIPAGVDSHGLPTRARLVLFRKPIEQRAQDAVDRRDLLATVLSHLVAVYLNLDPRDIDPRLEY